VALAGFFSRLQLRETAVRVVKALSPHTFGVYLFHTNTLIFLTAIYGRFGWLATAPVWELVAVTAGVTALIFFVGIAADWLLSQGMRLLGINRLLKKLDGKRSAE
jgi:surface polysaccharide O-acyltransferase-like enzyme